MKYATVLLLVFVMALTGCKEDQPAEKVESVDWYKAHDAERIATVNECKSNPGELAGTPNCINAKSAHDQTVFGSKNFAVKAVPPKFSR